jgi:hypothetical protein
MVEMCEALALRLGARFSVLLSPPGDDRIGGVLANPERLH